MPTLAAQNISNDDAFTDITNIIDYLIDDDFSVDQMLSMTLRAQYVAEYCSGTEIDIYEQLSNINKKAKLLGKGLTKSQLSVIKDNIERVRNNFRSNKTLY